MSQRRTNHGMQADDKAATRNKPDGTFLIAEPSHATRGRPKGEWIAIAVELFRRLGEGTAAETVLGEAVYLSRWAGGRLGRAGGGRHKASRAPGVSAIRQWISGRCGGAAGYRRVRITLAVANTAAGDVGKSAHRSH